MNTKTVIGVIVVIILIVVIGIVLEKKPTAPAMPADQASVTTSATPVQPAVTAPTSSTSSGQAKPSTITSTTTSDGMKIEITKEGTGPAIVNGQTAEMLYTGKLADGTVFDSTANHGNTPFSFQLGAGMVIKGWDEGILGMKVGEERTLIIPADLAYGAAGYPPVIPQNATLTFDVTLLGIK